MEIQEEMNFMAVTYDNLIYHFIIDNEGKIYCLEFGDLIKADMMEIKPNFVLSNQNHKPIYSLVDYLRDNNRYYPNGMYPFDKFMRDDLRTDEEKTQNHLISRFIIDEDVFTYLVTNKKITYSVDMALLYGFDKEYAYDSYCQGRAFKSYKYKKYDKDKILVRQKRGIFR